MPMHPLKKGKKPLNYLEQKKITFLWYFESLLINSPTLLREKQDNILTKSFH
jgi:hypothetical protein